MKRLFFLHVALLAAWSTPVRAAVENRVYELRTYHAHPGKLEALHARFRDHTVKLFAKHGMTSVGYWVPKANEENVLVYLMSYPDRAARDRMWRAFSSDPEWKAVYARSTAGGKLVARVEKRFLEPTGYSPVPKIAAEGEARLFELRQYTTHPGKLAGLDARFRDHTLALFGKHGMTNVAYFHLMDDQEGADHTLVYLLAHRDEAARNASFDAFRSDPDWQAARKASEADGPLLVPKGVESTLLVPTDYSPMR